MISISIELTHLLTDSEMRQTADTCKTTACERDKCPPRMIVRLCVCSAPAIPPAACIDYRPRSSGPCHAPRAARQTMYAVPCRRLASCALRSAPHTPHSPYPYPYPSPSRPAHVHAVSPDVLHGWQTGLSVAFGTCAPRRGVPVPPASGRRVPV